MWILDLTLRDYVRWCGGISHVGFADDWVPNSIQSRADHDSYEETNPHQITWAVWFTIVHGLLDEDENGCIPVVEGVGMLKCETTLVQCEDGVCRPFFVVWIVENETGKVNKLTTFCNSILSLNVAS